MVKFDVLAFTSFVSLCACATPMAETVAEAHDDVGVTTQALTISNCSEGQILALGWSIWPEARRIATDGRNYAAVDPNRFSAQTWFGYPVSDHVIGTLEAIDDAMAREDSDILCDEGHLSCVDHIARAQGENTVRLCQAFWEIPYEEQVLTLLHELSHHHGAPDDSATNPEDAFNLARTDPTAAGTNGYNYEYYYTEFL